MAVARIDIVNSVVNPKTVLKLEVIGHAVAICVEHNMAAIAHAQGLRATGRVDALSKRHVLNDDVTPITHRRAMAVHGDTTRSSLSRHGDVVGKHQRRVDVDRTAHFEHDRTVGLADGIPKRVRP